MTCPSRSASPFLHDDERVKVMRILEFKGRTT